MNEYGSESEKLTNNKLTKSDVDEVIKLIKTFNKW